MVQTDLLSPAALIEAMEQGRFYASTGVILKDLIIDNNTLTVEVEEGVDITYKISFIGCKTGEKEPEELLIVNGNRGSFELTSDVLYVRCKIISSKHHQNPIEDLFYETAWTQPVQYQDLH